MKEAVERNYNLLFSYVETTYKSFEELPKMVREKNAEGVLFMWRIHPAMIKDIAALSIPVVLVDTAPRVEGVNSFQIDNVSGGQMAAECLLAQGHENIAMLVPRDAVPSIEQRLAGFRAAFEKFDRRFSRSANVVEADDSQLLRRAPSDGRAAREEDAAHGTLLRERRDGCGRASRSARSRLRRAA